MQSDILFKAAVDTEQMLTARYNIRGKKVDDPGKTSNYIPSIVFFFKHPVSVALNSNILQIHCPSKVCQTERGQEKLNDIV